MVGMAWWRRGCLRRRGREVRVLLLGQGSDLKGEAAGALGRLRARLSR